MAADTRTDRQLMRQRGAGTRNVVAADLELDLNGGSREERQLMRQRGAGNRQIENINFGFSFPTPTRSSRSRTPQIVTPKRSSREPSHLSHGSRPSRQPSLPPLAADIRDGVINDPARRLSKRRRLSQVSNTTVPISESANLRSVRDYEARVADAEEARRDLARDRQDVFDTIPSSPLFEPRSDPNKENENAGYPSNVPLSAHATTETKPVAKKRKRKSIGQQSLRKKKRSSNQSVESTLLAPNEKLAEPTEEARLSPERTPELFERESEAPVAVSTDHVFSQSLTSRALPSEPKKQISKPRKKRKSITYNTARKKRRSSGNSTQVLADDSKDIHTQKTPDPAHFETIAQVTDDEEPVRRTRNGAFVRHSPRTRPSHSPAESEYETDSDDPDRSFMPNDADLEPPTPAPPRHKKLPKAGTKAPRETDQAGSRKHSQREKNRFPITTYRLSHPSALPVITEEGAEDDLRASDDEAPRPSRVPQALQSSSQPNSVDVLSQTAHEVILSAINNLSTANLQLSSSRLKQFKQTLQTFRSTLTNNLLTLSTTLTHKQTLESRVRKSAREKADLQARWLEVRRQRDMLDLKKDRIRRDHWEAEAQATQAWEASESARKIELELDGHASSAKQEPDLEFTLRSLAKDVGHSSHGGSILDRVRGLNDLLEDVAGNLDTR